MGGHELPGACQRRLPARPRRPATTQSCKGALPIPQQCLLVSSLLTDAPAHGPLLLQAVHPRKVKQGRHASTWAFDSAAPLVLRCPASLLQRGLHLVVELCASHALLPEEAARLPARPQQAARQVDEVCLAWAVLDLSTLPTLHAARSLRVPLRGGPLVQPGAQGSQVRGGELAATH